MNQAIIEHRLTAVENAIEKIAEAVQEIAQNTTQIAQLEARHSATKDGVERAFAEIAIIKNKDEKTDERLKAIEVAMPGLNETRALVMKAMVGVVTIVGLAMITLVVMK